MMTWKRPLDSYQWLIYQVWYLEVAADEVLPQQPLLIPNPRCHLVISPEDQPYHYSGPAHGMYRFRQSSADGDWISRLNWRIAHHSNVWGITFQPGALYQLYNGASTVLNQCGWFPWLNTFLPIELHQKLLSLKETEQVLPALGQHFDSLELTRYTGRLYRFDSKSIDYFRAIICRATNRG